MTKEFKIYTGLFILIVIGIFYSNHNARKQINWSETYLRKHKIPYGTFVLYNELNSLFPDKKIENISLPPYSFLMNNERKGFYLFINNNLSFGKEEFGKLMDFVFKGNDVCISAHRIDYDTIGIETKYLISNKFKDSLYFKLVNSKFKNHKYTFDRNLPVMVFEKIDTLNTTVLGETIFINSNGDISKRGANFIKVDYGEGHFFFHTFPEAFTNYFILNSPNENYTSGVLSYFNNAETIYWDSYYKTGRPKIESPLHFLFSQDALKWAYYMFLIGVLLFVIFEGKRKQRSIPIIEPVRNRTLGFTRTIANMYFEKSDHKKIALNKINYFLEYIRIRFFLNTSNIDKQFLSTLSAKADVSLIETQKLFDFFNLLKKQDVVTKADLIKLEDLIEKFKHQNK